VGQIRGIILGYQNSLEYSGTALKTESICHWDWIPPIILAHYTEF